MEWVEFSPNEVAELDGDMYFLYCGEVAIPSTVDETRSNNEDFAMSVDTDDLSDKIFGEVQFAEALEASLRKDTTKTKSKAAKAKGPPAPAAAAPPAWFVAGPAGAAALRISGPRLLRRMQDDDELSRSVQRLVLRCLLGEKVRRTTTPREGGGGRRLSSRGCGR